MLKELIQGYGSVYPPDDDAFGGLLGDMGKGAGGPSKELLPVMAMCKTTLHSDVLAVSWSTDRFVPFGPRVAG